MFHPKGSTYFDQPDDSIFDSVIRDKRSQKLFSTLNKLKIQPFKIYELQGTLKTIDIVWKMQLILAYIFTQSILTYLRFLSITETAICLCRHPVKMFGVLL